MSSFDNEIDQIWSDEIVPSFPVPDILHPWQADAISLLLEGHSVALCVPTGAGKTLPQLAASLFFNGNNRHILTKLKTALMELVRVKFVS